MPALEQTGPIDIVWNITSICPWDCPICCVSAQHVYQSNGLVHISTPDLSEGDVLTRDTTYTSIYDQALAHRQARRLELTLDEKSLVLENMKGLPVRVDIAGGDALAPAENLVFLQRAASTLGREALTLSVTGAGLARCPVEVVAESISELNFTFDGASDADTNLRPNSYSASNLRRAKKYAAAGVSVRAECPLTSENCRPEVLKSIYRQLHDAGIGKLLAMRLFPVGRGRQHSSAIPSTEEHLRAVATLRDLEAAYGTPEVTLQCALKHLEGTTMVNPCDAVTSSLGLTWKGVLLVSPWATNRDGQPLSDDWVLGNLASDRLSNLLATEKALTMRRRANENYGHCKVFAYLHGSSSMPAERLFEKSDPMYVTSRS